MKKKTFIILLIIAAILVLIQFIPAERPEYTAKNPDDLIVNNQIPEDISAILKNACYDCHSNETNYPWYAHVYPVKLLIYKDVKKGREALNFSNWESLKKLDKASVLDDIGGEVLEGDMPMKIYTCMHSDAKLSIGQRNEIAAWSEEFADALFE